MEQVLLDRFPRLLEAFPVWDQLIEPKEFARSVETFANGTNPNLIDGRDGAGSLPELHRKQTVRIDLVVVEEVGEDRKSVV